MDPITNTRNVELFGYNAESLAQWKVERGTDRSDNAFGLIFCLLLFPGPGWVCAILLFPFALYNYVQGKKLIKEGKEEGGWNRGYRTTGSESISTNAWEREVSPRVRRVPAPIGPPAHLRQEQPRHLYEAL